MSVTRRQFFAFVSGGAAATLLPLPELTHAEPEPAPKVAIDGAKGKAFLITEVRAEAFSPHKDDVRVHVEAIEIDGYMHVAFDLSTFKFALRPNDVLYLDIERLYEFNWPPPLSISRGRLSDIEELTLKMPSLAEREAMDAWRDEQ